MREVNNLGSSEISSYRFPTNESLYTGSGNATSNIMMAGGDSTTLQTMFNDGWIKRYMSQLQMEIIVRGSVKRYIGMMVDINWNAMLQNTSNSFYAGRYLIKSIEHIFMPGSEPVYKQKLRIVKTGFKDKEVGEGLQGYE
jgi:hypothetical protein